MTKTEVKHVAPVEFGEGIAQFVIERSAYGNLRYEVPVLAWVKREPMDPKGKFDFCNKPHPKYEFTEASIRFVSTVPGNAIAGRTDVDTFAVCACVGRFIE